VAERAIVLGQHGVRGLAQERVAERQLGLGAGGGICAHEVASGRAACSLAGRNQHLAVDELVQAFARGRVAEQSRHIQDRCNP
jgi:hypothetical protein